MGTHEDLIDDYPGEVWDLLNLIISTDRWSYEGNCLPPFTLRASRHGRHRHDWYIVNVVNDTRPPRPSTRLFLCGRYHRCRRGSRMRWSDLLHDQVHEKATLSSALLTTLRTRIRATVQPI